MRLHMDSLETKSSRSALRKALNELPKELTDTYDDALKRISPDHKELAYQIFSWLVHALRPLTEADLQYALAVQEGMTELDEDDLPDGKFILSICAGLVILQHDDTQLSSEDSDSKQVTVLGLVRQLLTFSLSAMICPTNIYISRLYNSGILFAQS